MRLPLTITWVVSLSACAVSTTQSVSMRTHVYADDEITVISPVLAAHVAAAKTRVDARYAVDAVGGATRVLTVDAVASATRFSETRHQVGVDATQSIRQSNQASVGYVYSSEPDHQVHAPSVSVSRKWRDETVIATLRYQWLHERIGRVGEPRFSTQARGHRVDAGWNQVVSSTWMVRALGSATVSHCGPELGCFANPYRHVGAITPIGRVALSERHPPQRVTGAGALRSSWSIAPGTAWHSGYRVGGDSWGVWGHTMDHELARQFLSDRLVVRPSVRSTFQQNADFYRSRYVAGPERVPRWRTADAELSDLWNLTLQLHAQWIWRNWKWSILTGHMWNRYPDFPSLPRRDAWIAGGGADVSF